MYGPSSVGTIRPNINDIFSIMYVNNADEVYIDRTRTTIVDILAIAGGFANIILFITRMVSKTYSVPLFKSKVASKLYYMQ
jgi:hypothetical protein